MSRNVIYIVLSDPRERHEPILKTTPNRVEALKACKRYLIKHNAGKHEFWRSKVKAEAEAKKIGLSKFYTKYSCAWLVFPRLFMKRINQ
jgi:hypothetical protein